MSDYVPHRFSDLYEVGNGFYLLPTDKALDRDGLEALHQKSVNPLEDLQMRDEILRFFEEVILVLVHHIPDRHLVEATTTIAAVIKNVHFQMITHIDLFLGIEPANERLPADRWGDLQNFDSDGSQSDDLDSSEDIFKFQTDDSDSSQSDDWDSSDDIFKFQTDDSDSSEDIFKFQTDDSCYSRGSYIPEPFFEPYIETELFTFDESLDPLIDLLNDHLWNGLLCNVSIHAVPRVLSVTSDLVEHLAEPPSRIEKLKNCLKEYGDRGLTRKMARDIGDSRWGRS
ncbi:hypothetical protein QBC34DRAFT_380687 [Podospora aff. communis PSN243]|uniref:Uncharacterized protein n=1 Tax=Podospora aff. communis PSN243 TaxID=3040156 RepID=A0AAV9GLK7_9PEZI|nr:hypothetical protein QBC34DRAFT_380687 [Podospora aff. communis PSN243]